MIDPALPERHRPIPPAERQQWIGDYLRDRLAAADRERIEIAMLADESLRDEIEAEWLLMRVAGEAADPERADGARARAAPASAQRHDRGQVRTHLRRPHMPRLDWRLAAAFVLGVGVAGLGSRMLPDRQADEGPLLASLPVVDVPAWRSSDAVRGTAPLAIDAGGPTLVRLAAPTGSGPFRVRVRDARGTLATLDAIEPDDSGELLLVLRLPAEARDPVLLTLEVAEGAGWTPVRELRIAPTGPGPRNTGSP
jgi:hypothetical protein